MGPIVLKDSLFRNHVASESDQQLLDAFRSSACQSQASADNHASVGPAPALCVNLQYEHGCEIPVKLFHVTFDSLNPEHWIGIREIHEEGSAVNNRQRWCCIRASGTTCTHACPAVRGQTGKNLRLSA